MTKQSIILSIVALLVLGSITFLTLNKQPTRPVETTSPTSTAGDVDKDLNQIDSTNFDKEFENIDKDINGL